MHDDVIGENYVQFTHLFNGEGSQDRTTLFFYYDVLETAAVGTTYFDITISDACDTDLNELPIAGSRYIIVILPWLPYPPARMRVTPPIPVLAFIPT